MRMTTSSTPDGSSGPRDTTSGTARAAEPGAVDATGEAAAAGRPGTAGPSAAPTGPQGQQVRQSRQTRQSEPQTGGPRTEDVRRALPGATGSLATAGLGANDPRTAHRVAQRLVDGAPRTGRYARPTLGREPFHLTIASKITAVVGGLLVVLVVSSGILLEQLNTTSAHYDTVLSGQVRQVLLARKVQVEFKKQVQEWKDILLRGQNPTDRATYTTNFRDEYTYVNGLTDQLVRQVTDPEVLADVNRFRQDHVALQASYEKALTAFVATGGIDPRVADTQVRGLDRPVTDVIEEVATDLQGAVDKAVAQQKAESADRQRLLLILGLVFTAALAAGLVVVVRRIVLPIRRLTDSAYLAASETLPLAVKEITTSTESTVNPDLPRFPVETHDELADLAVAMNSMQDKALDLAKEQHRREREIAAMLLNLGRRNQALLARVLNYITDLERIEQDPDVVSELFRIDHATTRIRRNAASMLVLAGAQPAPSRAQAVPVDDVMRAALSEIEDYIRVDLHHIEETSIVGGAAADLTHLLAELMENATNFSPPTTRVTVVGQRVANGYRIRVIDQGVGMTREELEIANRRVTDAAVGRSDARLLGLHVVGRLADRHGLQVELEASAGLGITATVVVPLSTLATGPEVRRPAPVLAGAGGGSAETARALATAAAAPASLQAAMTTLPPAMPPSGPIVIEQPAANGSAPAAAVSPTALPPALPPLPVPSSNGGLPPTSPSTSGAPRPVVVPLTSDPEVTAPIVIDLTDRARREPQPPATPPGGTTGAVPTRVRGTSLAKLGFMEEGTDVAFAAPTGLSSERLRSFQLDVEAARRAAADEPGSGSFDLGPTNGPTTLPTRSRSNAPRTGAPRGSSARTGVDGSPAPTRTPTVAGRPIAEPTSGPATPSASGASGSTSVWFSGSEAETPPLGIDNPSTTSPSSADGTAATPVRRTTKGDA